MYEYIDFHLKTISVKFEGHVLKSKFTATVRRNVAIVVGAASSESLL